MSDITSPGVARWRQCFAENPLAALDGALTGRLSLGQYDRARPAEALRQLLGQAQLAQADAALQTWLAERLGQALPDGLTPKRYASALVEAFRTIHFLPLPDCRAWCAARPAELRAWLREFYMGNSRDPEGALLVALAYYQPDRSLLFLWHDVIRRGRPETHIGHALLGLRKMPADDHGAVEHGLPRALLRGLLDWGETLVKSGDKKGQAWLREVNFLAAVYPQSREKWGARFREILQVRDISRDLHHWLDARYPTVRQNQPTARVNKGPATPLPEEMKAVLNKIEKDYHGARPSLGALLDRHRHYAQASGDSYYLVRAFSMAGERLLERDPAWSRDLAHEAARWEPGNPHTWSLLARALEAAGDWRRAEAVYWYARRRFPHDAQNHNQLGHALLLHEQQDLGEAVFRQAIRLFPGNPVCWAELGHSLRVANQHEKAVAVYREAQRDFYHNPIIANALADTLIDLHRLEEAESALSWAEQVVPDDARNQQILENIRRRLGRAQAGEQVQLRQLRRPPSGAGGDLAALSDITGQDLRPAPALGRAGLLRRSGRLEAARQELDATREGSAKLIETGLLRAAETDWQAAAHWFDGCWERYAGDGVLRVHRLRAQARAGQVVDWSQEKALYPDLLPVILTEEGKSPSYGWDAADQNLPDEQRQTLWYSGLLDGDMRDCVEEDFLTARQAA